MNEEHNNELGEVPNDASEQLPWFLNGSLPATQASHVAQQLKRSPRMRDEAQVVQAIAESVREHQACPWQPSARHFNELVAQVDAMDEPRKRPLDAVVQYARDMLHSLTPRTAWVVGAQACVIVALAGMLMLGKSPTPGTATFETLTSTPTTGASLRVIFTPEATMADVLRALEPAGGEVVGGPTALGVFTVSLPAQADVESIRATLHDDPATLLVQAQAATLKK